MKKYLFLIASLIGAILFPSGTFAAPNGSLIKSASNSAVYYLNGGLRYAFPNESVFFSWYPSFSGVLTVSSQELATYPLAGNVTYRPGKWLVKIQTNPKVYAVSRYGTLRWVSSEQIASQLYGTNWNTKVKDIPDAFFINYHFGPDISNTSMFNVALELGINQIADDLSSSVAQQTPTQSSSIASIGGCDVFPADNAWNEDVSHLPLNPNSATYMAAIGLGQHVHPDFGSDPTYGIPYEVVPATQPNVPITFTAYGDESDPGPYPIPANAPVEQDGDAHVLVLDTGNCHDYELYSAQKDSTDAGWSAESGAVWDFSSDHLRPNNWTSADAAGLPILPGLVRYEEVAAGSINHAIRFTASNTQRGFIYPATHYAGSENAAYPPMGLRVRLKANYDISHFTGQSLVIATALKKYGMILADIGSNWYISGATDPRWNDDNLNQLKTIPGSAFEAVQTGSIMK